MDVIPSAVNISLFKLLREEFQGVLEPLRCTKATLVHLSHTLEDLVLKNRLPALLFTGFQESSHWRKETERYRALADIAQQVCVFAGGTLPPESNASELHVTLRGDDPLRQEWFVVILCTKFSVLLCGQDRNIPSSEEAIRQFDTLWSFDPAIVGRVLDMLEKVVLQYRPDRFEALQRARLDFPPLSPDSTIITTFTGEMIRFEEELHQTLHRTTATLDQQLQWRDDLTATLVHDMRSPLQSLAMAIDMLRAFDQFDQETIEHMLAAARRSTNNLTDLVQLILDTNQLAAGQFALSWQPIQPSAWLKETLDPLASLYMANQQELEIDIDPRVKVLWGDKTLLSRVLQNLVTNACKFTPPKGKISVTLAPTPQHTAIEIRVRDTGDGISTAALPHIFNRYYQVRKGDRRGSGLGLYFCRLASEAHNGTIRAASQIGQGTTFTVVLPAVPPKN